MDEKTKKPVPGSFAALMSPSSPEKPKVKEHKVERPKKIAEKPEVTSLSPISQGGEKEKTPTKPRSKRVEKRERQLNAWISSLQNESLDRLYFHLRAQGIRVKKGELVGVAIEILSRILENLDSRKIDVSVLDKYIEKLNKT